MTFDQWCDSKHIKGNWREALFHHIMATRSGDSLDDPKEWEKAWSELLSEIAKSLP